MRAARDELPPFYVSSHVPERAPAPRAPRAAMIRLCAAAQMRCCAFYVMRMRLRRLVFIFA